MTEGQLMVAGVVLTALFTAITSVVGWLVSRGIKTREDVRVLQSEVAEIRADQITCEKVREVVEGVLQRRDQANAERRTSWDEMFSMRLQHAVAMGVQQCQAMTKAELELLVPRIVREVLNQTNPRMKKPSSSGSSPDGPTG